MNSFSSVYAAFISALLLQFSHAITPFRWLDVLNTIRTDHNVVDMDDDDVLENTLEQPLNHFDRTDARTFTQRYFSSHRFVRSHASRQLAFLCVGGEGPPLTTAVLRDSVHCSGDMLYTAQQIFETNPDVSIHLYALEHRYYGKSYPLEFGNETVILHNDPTDEESPVSNQHLVYLSSRQALEDLKNFVATMNDYYAQSTNLEWITFGGSYPGMLAAWARLRFPHLIQGAISNSAPIQARLDFANYNNHVAYDLARESIGGSETCYEIFVQGHAQLRETVLMDQQKVADLLNLCDESSLHDRKNLQLLFGDGVYDLGTQGNDPSCTEPLCNIASTCDAALDHYRATQDDPYAAMETLSWLVREQNGNECQVVDWNQTLQTLKDPTAIPLEEGVRSWLWQTCTEFGFYQTCETTSDCPYGKGYHPLDQDLTICSIAFDVDYDSVQRNVQDTNAEYGGWNLAGSRIFSITGDVDPWSELALTRQRSPDLSVYSVPGASHHFWTHAIQETDSVEIQDARKAILQQVEGWLGLGLKDDSDLLETQ